MVDAVNRLYGPTLCPQCIKPNDAPLGFLCEPCGDKHIANLKGDIHLYQSKEKAHTREADFNKDT